MIGLNRFSYGWELEAPTLNLSMSIPEPISRVKLLRILFIILCTYTARTATGSTAAMRDPNKNVSRRPGSVHSGGNINGSSIVILSLNSNAVSLISLVKELIKQFKDLSRSNAKTTNNCSYKMLPGRKCNFLFFNIKLNDA